MKRLFTMLVFIFSFTNSAIADNGYRLWLRYDKIADEQKLNIASSPKINIRLLNHWDNLDRTVERSYADFSIWDWHKLPDYIYSQYKDYARACVQYFQKFAKLPIPVGFEKSDKTLEYYMSLEFAYAP